MRPREQLSAFVKDALVKGRSREEIKAALHDAGWTASEVSDAMNSWADTAFDPPIPRPRPIVTAREAFFYGLMFAALIMTAWHLTSISFRLIDIWLPEFPVPEGRAAWSINGIRFSIAVLVVFFPLFLIMNAKAERSSRLDTAKRRSALRRWFGFLTLLLAALSLLGDLVYVIYKFLDGDLTSRSLARAAVVAVVAGCIFLYFRKETEEADSAQH
ncbi:MAG: hypothetical protein CMM50_05870 [Rhodospirillaceae bacterium]|nr:hypothetical protein [Rhodospirillaceae bacterium]|tara:strand:+ start:908 stop:1552 length:645 start_codon:yes stop_codon:yes gene_type:complete